MGLMVTLHATNRPGIEQQRLEVSIHPHPGGHEWDPYPYCKIDITTRKSPSDGGLYWPEEAEIGIFLTEDTLASLIEALAGNGATVLAKLRAAKREQAEAKVEREAAVEAEAAG